VNAERLTESAEAIYNKGKLDARRANLRLNGATDAEINFLLDRRVELNAFPSDRLVRFVERKLTAHGVRKVRPSTMLLQKTYQTFVRGEQARVLVRKALAAATNGPAIAVPTDLKNRVADFLKKNPRCRRDEAVAKIARSRNR
jgi:hypothetical protein